ncbi:hypothetical protein AB0N79_39575 [Streptomyces microflavus]|uniref:hypothetical protein n=1 Tax=Streptomyces microflavus TaxID=1919 RepID=UPI0034134F9F
MTKRLGLPASWNSGEAGGLRGKGGLAILVRNNDELRLLGQTAPNGTRMIVLPGYGGSA